MKVVEIFKSIQGESSFAGLPCVFVRLSGCNLRCSYCDTAYAYNEGREMAPPLILETIGKMGRGIVAVTGGEPLLQEKELPGLVGDLLDMGYTVLIETNGSLPVSAIPEGAVKIMDIKCPDSGMSGMNLWENIEHLGPRDEVKFVISSVEDYEWAKGIVREYGLDNGPRTLFSAAWGRIQPEEIASRILEDGLFVRMQLQLHKIIWGDARCR